MNIVFLDRASLPVPLPRPATACEWTEYDSTAPADTIARAMDADVLIVNKLPLTADTLAALPRLKLVAVAATGVNNVDLAACRARGVPVCNVRNYGPDAVAEHAFMLMIALKRNLLAYRQQVNAGDWNRAEQFCLFGAPITDLAGQTLVLLGSGAIGGNLADKARAFGMKVVLAERKGAAAVREGHVAFDEALAQADVVSLHLPLTDATRNLIGATELASMKPTAVLVNTARGGLVDEVALLDALKAGTIAGAGFDVLVEEPPRRGNPLLDVSLPNLIVTPHVAWASRRAMDTMARMLIDNIDAFIAGRPQNVVN